MTEWVASYGLAGLFMAAFLGATLVPVSSEVAFVAALAGGVPPLPALLVASAGNALGALVNYGLGALFAEKIERKLEANQSGRRALGWTRRWGRWSLLGSWLPVVGDPLCLAAGLVRVPLWFFALVGIGTRVARYAVILQLWLLRG